MVRYMADSVDCTAIPDNIMVPAVGVRPISLRCGYAAPSSYHRSSTSCGNVDVMIDVAATNPSADVLDIENGDATPASAPAWVQAHNALGGGFPAILYVNRANITAVANALTAAGLQVVRDYRWWISTLDSTTAVADMTGVVAVQAWNSAMMGANIDLSVVYDDTWKASGPATYSVQGEIAEKYHNTPGLAAWLGEPITNETGCPDGVGRFNHFALNNGSIYWTPTYGAFTVYGAIAAAWAALGWERSPLGYPVSDEFSCCNDPADRVTAGVFDRFGNPVSYRQSNFEHGFIRWTATGGAEVFSQ